MTGPLSGVRVVELAALGPAPFACMLLSDLGAQVLRVARPQGVQVAEAGHRVLQRGRPTLALDLKQPGAAGRVLELVAAADVLVEGMRPGVAERLGVGPGPCLERNPRLVYGRMTGWGQDGPLAQRAGHDLNYAALAGALGAIGEPGRKPVAPLNLVADFGGGSAYLVIGVLAALLERGGSGRGQVVDAAMVDGVSSLLAMTYSLRAAGQWRDDRGVNLLDGGAPFYDTYRCADGRYVAVAALEPAFFATLVDALALTDCPEQYDESRWPELRQLLAAAFAREPRDVWARRFAGVDACVTPVLHLGEAPLHPHLAARGSVVTVDGVPQPAPAPQFSRTPGELGDGLALDELLAAWGVA